MNLILSLALLWTSLAAACPWEQLAEEGLLQARAERTARMAKEAGLNVASADAPTYRRVRYVSRAGGKDVVTYSYLDMAGREVKGARLREIENRLRELKIVPPPNWDDVTVSLDPKAHIQARGKDKSGAVQSLYHPAWNKVRDAHKFELNIHFGHALNRIRETALEDLKSPGLTKAKVLASMVLLMDGTQVRVGNEGSAEDGKFGLSTFNKSHIKIINEQEVQLNFHGKHGIKNDSQKVVEESLIPALRQLMRTPGQRLFQYYDDGGHLRQITAQEFNDYLTEISGNGFTAKSFRTWWATVNAMEYLTYGERPKSAGAVHGDKDRKAWEKQLKEQWKEAVEAAAFTLNNQPAQARKSYIDPIIWEVFSRDPDAIWDAFRAPRGPVPRDLQRLTPAERAVLRFLEAQHGALAIDG